jgi:flagellar hook-length control protein FliK
MISDVSVTAQQPLPESAVNPALQGKPGGNNVESGVPAKDERLVAQEQAGDRTTFKILENHTVQAKSPELFVTYPVIQNTRPVLPPPEVVQQQRAGTPNIRNHERQEIKATNALEMSRGVIDRVAADLRMEQIQNDSVKDSAINRLVATSSEKDVQTVASQVGQITQLPQTMIALDTALGNFVSMMNNKMPVVEGAGIKNISVNPDQYDVLEKQYELQQTQYSTGQSGAGLKIEAYTAKIKVYPPDLGQVSAEIVINKGMAELTLVTEHRHVKEFIETSLHQLRETFMDANINLSQVNVHHGSANDRQDLNRHQRFSNGMLDEEGIEREVAARVETQTRRQSDSMIDAYI